MTVMSDGVDVVLPRRMSIEEWSKLDVERHVELVQGVPVVSPYERVGNLRMGARLGWVIEQACRGEVCGIPQVCVELSGPQDAPTVRIPDLVIVDAGFSEEDLVIPASVVRLAVEVVSPSSVERDWVTKRDEYAVAGIPAYLIVDRFAGRLVLFDRIADGRYADPSQDGDVVRLTLGTRQVEVRLDALIR